MVAIHRFPSRIPLLSLGVGLAAAVVMFASISTVPVHTDEYGWIRSGYYYTDLLLRREGTLEAWEGMSLGPWGSLNMPLGKWLLGIPLVAYRYATGRGVDGDRGAGSFAADHREGIPPDVLRVARGTSAVVSAVTCAAIFLLGVRLGGAWPGLVAAGLTLASGYFRRWGVRAATDAPYILFLVLGVLAGLSLLQARSGRVARRLTLVSGLMTGLACSIKVTGLPLGAAFFVACLLPRVRLHLTTWSEAGKLGLMSLATSLVVIFALNPFLWPTVRPADPLRYQAEIERASQDFARESGMPPPSARLMRLRLAPAMRFPLLYVRWKKLMDVQRNRGLGHWRDSRWIGVHRTLLSPSATFFGGGLLLLAGAGWAMLRAWRSWRNRIPDGWFAPTAFFLVQYLFVLLLLGLNWDRYYLPTLVGGQILAGGALVAAVRKAMPRLAEAPVPSRQADSTS